MIIAGSVTDDEAKKIWPQGFKAPRPLYPHRAATARLTGLDDCTARARTLRSAPLLFLTTAGATEMNEAANKQPPFAEFLGLKIIHCIARAGNGRACRARRTQ